MPDYLILDQPWQIELYRLNVLKYRLRLEIKGMTSHRGTRTTLQAVNETLRRNKWIAQPCTRKQEALEHLEAYIAEKEQAARAEGLME